MVIAREYVDGFSKFFDAHNPCNSRAKVLSTPTVLNICLDAEALLRVCGAKLRQAGGEIWDETEFKRADVSEREAVVTSQHLPTGKTRVARGRQLIWDLFPGAGDEITIYLFHYHQVNGENPGSLLEMYEDFFTIRC